MRQRVHITITGIVQGVGFRPFVYNLARQLGLSGWVLNHSGGVDIAAEGNQAALDEFLVRLNGEAPPLAVITGITVTDCQIEPSDSFVIRSSDGSAERSALISPDVAVCPECLDEMLSPADRRYGYPFINCTNCGPRYTIIRDVPYDRPKTTMAGFAMCRDCKREYEDPANRRFHAQPNACQVCGPSYRLIDAAGQDVPGDPLAVTKYLIGQGAIIAIKGIGGYHLACDARNEQSVSTLRNRKIREDKPLAVMAGSLETVRTLCFVSAAEEQLLHSLARPIVLLRKLPGYDLAASVAPGNPWLGIMQPYAPVHALLMDNETVWVMTSGNTSNEPIIYDDDEVFGALNTIADYFLIHNRPIYRRADDSVARVFAGQPYLIRRSRGYVPLPIQLAGKLPPVLAVGAELKNTFCLTKGNLAFVGPHIGDLENLSTYDSYLQAIEHWQRLFAVTPQFVAYDLHPEYLSTKFALTLDMPRVGVQHHHAHIAAVMAEHGLDESVIGVAFDGTGYGTDGKLWGGEFLVAELTGFRRLAHCRYLPLPGGAKAITEPWRLAAWTLHELYGTNLEELGLACVREWPPGWRLAIEAAAKGLNAPLTSSAGRLFDAAAALLGLRQRINYEGQAAIELEQVADGACGNVLPYEIISGEPAVLDFLPAFAHMAAQIRQGQANTPQLAASFHTTVAHATVTMIQRISRQTGLKKVALSGGVFQNITLLTRIVAMLEQESFAVYLHRHTPPNDGGVALGQAIIAGRRSRSGCV